MKCRFCECCGSSLDYGEKCDCQSEQNRKSKQNEERFIKVTKTSKTGQIEFNLEVISNGK